MKDIPILFSTAMVKAILERRKTMTRRIVKPQPIDSIKVDGNLYEGNHKGYVKVDGHKNWPQQFAHEFSKWKPGDVLWVRESFWPSHKGDKVFYRADFNENYQKNNRWKPSIHMPKAAARIWLEVTDVRVERLHDISEDDAKAEGVETLGLYPGYDVSNLGKFEGLWTLINGRESWDQNPWLWVVSFKVLSTTGKPESIINQTASI